ncbi:MAG TPA: KH domain-containing protein [Candidatus Acidoferrales bacterium]|nr:KH domain-containing protein [Candidatus Acidoferrales bacterium]
MPGPDMFVKIPKERVGILIGPEGKTKQYLEDKVQVKLDIDKEGSVKIILSENCTDPSLLLRAKDMVTAIGRGFPPETAFRLIRNEDDIFDMIDLRVIFGRSESDITRIKGRIIGTEGKTRKLIEELTDADVVVYGHTIGIIGSYTEADAARNAVQMVIDGCEHHTVYNYLQKKRTELKKEKLKLWETPPEEK